MSSWRRAQTLMIREAVSYVLAVHTAADMILTTSRVFYEPEAWGDSKQAFMMNDDPRLS